MHMSTTVAAGAVTGLGAPCHALSPVPSRPASRVREPGAVEELVGEIEIDAPPSTVYQVVADVTRTGEWSPECVRARWLDGATHAAPGARYRGHSRNGWRRWSTTATVRLARPGEELAWDVSYLGRPVASWRYELVALGDGRTQLREWAHDRRERWLQVVSPWVTGSRDRAARNADTVATSLQRIKAIAEAAAPVAPRDGGGAAPAVRSPPPWTVEPGSRQPT